MNAPSMESVFLILSGVILAAGVLYWFWSHIQLTQKKVQLLENAVFELRGMLTGGAPAVAAAQDVEAPETMYNDLKDDDEEWDAAPAVVAASSVEVGSTSLEQLSGESDDLQPGGRIQHAADEETSEQFRELFIKEQPTSPSVKAVETTESLESMPVKELRRLAEQRGLTGVSDLKKKELISALRQQVVPKPEEKEKEKEITLDLVDADAAILE